MFGLGGSSHLPDSRLKRGLVLAPFDIVEHARERRARRCVLVVASVLVPPLLAEKIALQIDLIDELDEFGGRAGGCRTLLHGPQKHVGLLLLLLLTGIRCGRQIVGFTAEHDEHLVEVGGQRRAVHSVVGVLFAQDVVGDLGHAARQVLERPQVAARVPLRAHETAHDGHVEKCRQSDARVRFGRGHALFFSILAHNLVFVFSV